MKFPLYCPCIKHNICLNIGYPYIFFMIKTNMLFHDFHHDVHDFLNGRHTPWNPNYPCFSLSAQVYLIQIASLPDGSSNWICWRWTFCSLVWCNTADVAGDMERYGELEKSTPVFPCFSLSNLSDKERTKHVRSKPWVCPRRIIYFDVFDKLISLRRV